MCVCGSELLTPVSSSVFFNGPGYQLFEGRKKNLFLGPTALRAS